MPQYINPNGEKVRIASTSGHVVFIGEEPVDILPHMEAEAKAQGCMPYSMYQALEEKLKRQMEERMTGAMAPAGEKAEGEVKANAGDPEPGAEGKLNLEEDQKLKKVVEAIELMLDADNDDYFTGNGLPRAAAVNELAGFEVSKELREKAWEIVKAAAAKK